MKNSRYKGKKHGSFAIREGWLTKGLSAVIEHPDLFSKNNNYGADILGVGTAMGKAIHYWLKVAGLITDRKGQGVFLTEFGESVAVNDLYFENLATLWTLHFHIVSNKEDATLWYLFFQSMQTGEFTKRDMTEKMMEEALAYSNGEDFSEKSLESDVDVFLRMYTRVNQDGYDPEDKMRSPFADLSLVSKTVTGYRKELATFDNLSSLVVLYAIMTYVKDNKSVGIDELLEAPGSPGKILCLNRIILNDYLDTLDESGYIKVDRTAGLDQVYLTEGLTTSQIVDKYYEA